MKSLMLSIGLSTKSYMFAVSVQLMTAGLALLSKVSIDKGMSPYVFVVYRQAFATLSFAPFAVFLERGKSAPLSCSLLCQIFLVSLLGVTASLDLYYVALNYTSATFAAASNTTIPAMTFILAICLRMESISPKEWHGLAKIVGSVVCVSGALVFVLVKGPLLHFYPSSIHHQMKIMGNHSSSSAAATHHDISRGDTIKGSLFMLLANVFWSLWLIVQGPLMKQYPAKLRLIVLQCFFSWIQLAVCAAAVERKASSWKLRWDIHLLSMVYCGVISGGLTSWMRMWVIEKKGAVFTAMFTPLALIATAIFSVLVWRETLHLGSVFGAVLTVVGLYIFLWGKHKEGKIAKNNDEISEIRVDASNK